MPELEAEALLLQRIFLAEKWMVARLHYGHVDPREAGVGNIVNCGAAMYVAPVGIVNAADPVGAYAEAIEIASPHQSSYRPRGSRRAGRGGGRGDERRCDGALGRRRRPRRRPRRHPGGDRGGGRGGVRRDEWAAAIPVLRAAVEPFDTVGPHYRAPAMDARRPSRTKAIEELPVALGMVLVADGDFESAVLGGVNYGRDADSIASMAGRDLRRTRRARGDARRLARPHRGGQPDPAGACRPHDGRRGRRGVPQGRRAEPGARATAATRSSVRVSGLTWVQSPDLLAHELVASVEDGKEVDDVRRRWQHAGGQVEAPHTGLGQEGDVYLRALADELLASSTPGSRPTALSRLEPDDLGGHRGDLADTAGAHRNRRRPRRPAARRVARSRRGLLARQARREDPARGHPRDPHQPGPVAADRLVHRGRPARRRRATAGRGTGAARPPAWPRTSTACPRTTTSTSPCSPSA